MGRKKGKKVMSESERKEAFEEWKNEEEGEFFFLQMLKDRANELGVTEYTAYHNFADCTFKVEEFMESFKDIGKYFKVKGAKKFKKPINQMQIRTAFFGGTSFCNIFRPS
jgi:hypothetical protein